MPEHGAVRTAGLYVISILGAIALSALLVSVTGGSASAVWGALLDGSLRSPGAWGLTLTMMAPLLQEYDVRGGQPDTTAGALSGGNQQKVVIARELAEEPKVTIAAQPTRGLDVGAIEYVTGRIRDAAARGVGVLLISSEVEPLLAIADRIVVIHRGRIVGEMTRDAFDVQRLALLMGGRSTAA